MNIEKLSYLGLQKAVTACIRHKKAMERGSHAEKHNILHDQCDALARSLWIAASESERQAIDCLKDRE